MSSLGKQYAKAIYAAAESKNAVDDVYRELNSEEFIKIMKAEVFDKLKKATKSQNQIRVLQAELKKSFSEVTSNLLLVLAKNDRNQYFSEIVSSFNRLYGEKQNIVDVKIKIANQISEEALEKIKAEAKKNIPSLREKKLVYSITEDDNIIGGYILEFGTFYYDASIFHKLNLLKHKMNL